MTAKDAPVGVVNYGAGNLFSVLRGLRHVGFFPEVISQPEDVERFEKLVLPGVGAFGKGMSNLESARMPPALCAHAAAGKPLLGICLGAQLLMEWGTEYGHHKGLGLLEGGVEAIPKTAGMKIPHVGWSSLLEASPWTGTLLADIRPDDQFYFVHSFVCRPKREEDTLAYIGDNPEGLVAVISRKNVIGVQFHPELSSYAGIAILRRFRNL